MSEQNTQLLDLFKDNKEAMAAHYILTEKNNPVFLTGKAGTGKSTFIKLAITQSKTTCLVGAPSKIAALNVEGETLKSLFHLPKDTILPNDPILKNIKFNDDDGFRIFHADLLIIDDISMVSSATLDCIDVILKNFCESDKPFAGKKVLLVGDPFQLPPYVNGEDLSRLRRYYKSQYFFHANVFSEIRPRSIELKKNYRQENDAFTNILDSIRKGVNLRSTLSTLNKLCYNEQNRYKSNTERNCACLAFSNDTANMVNSNNFNDIKSQKEIYYAEEVGDFEWRGVVAQKELFLKKDVRIMFIKDHDEKLFVNGMMGYISELNESQIIVTTDDNKSFELKKEKWRTMKYKRNYINGNGGRKYVEVGSMLQYPVKIAWAITVHKSQGLTFDRVHLVNNERSFLFGQTYAALTRCRTIEGLSLKRRLTATDIKVDKNVVEFYETIDENRVEEVLSEIADKLETEEYSKMDENVLDYIFRILNK